VKNQKTGTIQKFEIVPENEIDTKLGKISYKSPVGSGLIGKSRGQSATIQTPTGSIELEILDISPLI
jgi:transcription elongation factor GreA